MNRMHAMLRIVAFLALVALPFAANAQSYPQVVATKPAGLVPLGFCQLSVSSSAVGLSSCSGGIPAGAAFIYAQPETAAVRYRDDGTAPTATVGYPVAVSQQLTYSGNISAIQFIAQSGTATLDVWFGR